MSLLTIDDYIEKGLTHEIHNSERKSFNSCRRRWDWIYRGRYYPRTTAKPLEFGTAYHIGMETYYSPTTWAFPNEVKVGLAKTAFAQECERQKQAALKAGAFFDDSVEQDYNERVALGIGMIEYYFTEISPLEDKGFIPWGVEKEFTVAIPHPDTGETMYCTCNECWNKWVTKTYDGLPTFQMERDEWKGLPVVYSGRVDMLAHDTNGNLWLYDWKTASVIQDDKEWLELDDQITSYVWALRKIGLNIVGFIYHEQLKGYPQAPQRNAKRRNGAAFSVNKTQSTDYDTYLRTVAKEDTDMWGAGVYDEFLAFLQAKGIKFHDRRQILKTQAQLTSVEQSIGEQALDMIGNNVRTYYNSSRFNCRQCHFFIPCTEKNAGGDYEYALDTMFDKKQHYYEILREKSTDK